MLHLNAVIAKINLIYKELKILQLKKIRKKYLIWGDNWANKKIEVVFSKGIRNNI